MRNIKLKIEYDGTDYHGWQIQSNLPTIQGEIESVLSKITSRPGVSRGGRAPEDDEPLRIIGSGRTDAGVHALGQTANFQTESKMTPDEFKKALNSLLPKDIVIVDAEEVSEDFHSRFSAISRTYKYLILNRSFPSAFYRNYAYFYPKELNLRNLQASGDVLLGKHDFSSFQKSGSDRVNPECIIHKANWSREGEFVHFDIEADSFLRRMVRAIVGTCLMLKDEKNPAEEMKKIINACNRSAAGPSAKAHGLYLIEVKYRSC